MKEIRSAGSEKAGSQGETSKLWLNESVLHNGLSGGSITREQENKQYQREPWLEERVTIIGMSLSQ